MRRRALHFRRARNACRRSRCAGFQRRIMLASRMLAACLKRISRNCSGAWLARTSATSSCASKSCVCRLKPTHPGTSLFCCAIERVEPRDSFFGTLRHELLSVGYVAGHGFAFVRELGP